MTHHTTTSDDPTTPDDTTVADTPTVPDTPTPLEDTTTPEDSSAISHQPSALPPSPPEDPSALSLQPSALPEDDPSALLPRASSLQQIIGGLIFGADRPLTLEDIRKCLQEVAAAPDATDAAKAYGDANPRDIQDVLQGLSKQLDHLDLGLTLVERQGGWRFQSAPAAGPWLRHLLKIGRPQRLSRSSLETLAIIAYRQPISKSEIEAIRGVGVDHLMKTLMELHLIRIVGRSELPGRPFLYGTTAAFLDHFGLRNLGELNAMDPTLQRSKPSERKKIHFKEKPKPEQPAEQEPEPGLISQEIAAEFKIQEGVEEPDVRGNDTSSATEDTP